MMTLVCLTMLTACSSSTKFHADGSDEDAAIDTASDTSYDSSVEVLPDETTEPECMSNGDCNDSDHCTEDRCEAGICEYIETCECREDADCEDTDPCTLDACRANICENERRVDISIETVEPVDPPLIYTEGDQILLRLRFTSAINIEVREMVWNIGADCSADGVIESDPATGAYHDEGGHCASTFFQLEGVRDDNFHEDLLLDVEVRDVSSGATLQGPVPRPLEFTASTADDNLTLRLINAFLLEAGVSRDIVLIADVFTMSDLRANVPIAGIRFAAEGPLCLAFAAPVLEGLTRENEG